MQRLQPINETNKLAVQITKLEISYELQLALQKSHSAQYGVLNPFSMSEREQELSILDHTLILRILRYVEAEPRKELQTQFITAYHQAMSDNQRQGDLLQVQETTTETVFSEFAIRWLSIMMKPDKKKKGLANLLQLVSGALLDLNRLEPKIHFSKLAEILLTTAAKSANEFTQEGTLQTSDPLTLNSLSLLARLTAFNLKQEVRSAADKVSSTSIVLQADIEKILPKATDTTYMRGFYQYINIKILVAALPFKEEFVLRDESGQLRVKECVEAMTEIIQRRLLTQAVITVNSLQAICTMKTAHQSLVDQGLQTIKDSSLEGLVRAMQEVWTLIKSGSLGTSTSESSPTVTNISNWIELIFLQGLYTAVPSLSNLEKLGLNDVVSHLKKLQQSSDFTFSLRDQQIATKIRESYDLIREKGMLPAQVKPRLMGVDKFSIGTEALNSFFDKTTNRKSIQGMIMLLDSSIYREYLLALSNSVVPSAEEQAANKDRSCFFLEFTVGMVWNLLSNLPPTSFYHKFSMGGVTDPRALSKFIAIVNYPSPSVMKYLPVMHFYDMTRDTPKNAEAIFTGLWQCTTPDCEYLVPIGDCGRLGHLGQDNISTLCPGCKKPIGQLGEDSEPNLRRLDIDEIRTELAVLLQEDEAPFRHEPSFGQKGYTANFDDSWVLAKYSSQITQRSVALFVHLIQNIVYLAAESQTQAPSSRFTSPLISEPKNVSSHVETLIKRDFELLKISLGCDDQRLFTIICIVVESVVIACKQDPQVAQGAHNFRGLVATEFEKVVYGIHNPDSSELQPKTTGLNDYYSRLQSKSGLPDFTESEQWSLVNGAMSFHEVHAK